VIVVFGGCAARVPIQRLDELTGQWRGRISRS
jgi:hypothetical protein